VARRRGRRPPSLRVLCLFLAMAVLAGACSPQQPSAEETTPPSTSTAPAGPATTSAPSTTTTATPPTTTTTSTPITAGIEPPIGAIVRVPEGDGPFPAVVLVHGGGWIVGTPESMEALAEYLTDQGFLTVNIEYQLSLRAPGFPAAVEDVVCAVAFAAEHELSVGSVTVIGHSAGAHIGAVAALDPIGFDDSCVVPEGEPARFVGLAGPYDSNSLSRIMAVFFGGERQDIPDIWDSGNPLLLVEKNPGLRALLIHGDADPVVPSDFSQGFLEALIGVGAFAELAELPGADHPDARDPAIVGPLIVDWLEGA
jgi:acetyl esterase/lipase